MSRKRFAGGSLERFWIIELFAGRTKVAGWRCAATFRARAVMPTAAAMLEAVAAVCAFAIRRARDRLRLSAGDE